MTLMKPTFYQKEISGEQGWCSTSSSVWLVLQIWYNETASKFHCSYAYKSWTCQPPFKPTKQQNNNEVINDPCFHIQYLVLLIFSTSLRSWPKSNSMGKQKRLFQSRRHIGMSGTPPWESKFLYHLAVLSYRTWHQIWLFKKCSKKYF